MVKNAYKTGDKVFAKVKGYPPWPARIEGDSGKKKYNVLFYGTQETGAIKPEDLCFYSKNKASYVPKYLKRIGYENAVNQIEEAIKKDSSEGNGGTEAQSSHDIDVSDTSSISSSVSEKKPVKRRVASLPDEPVQKKTPGKPRRRSAADSKEDLSEQPVLKRPRRKSNSSTSSGIKEGNSAANIEDIQEAQKINEDKESGSSEIDNKADEEQSKDIEESNQSAIESELDKTDLALHNDKSKAQTELTKNAEDNKKPKETEFVEIENNVDSTMQMEEGVSDEAVKPVEKITVNVEIVTEQTLKHDILYAEHVKKNADAYKDQPVESRQDSENQVLPVKLPSGIICGVKLHKEWPLKHSNEHDRALYDEQVAKSVLAINDLLTIENKAPDEIDATIIPDIQMSLESIKELTYGRDIESKRSRLDRLKKESYLITWDSKIKNSLGLDKASPQSALEGLKEFSQIDKDLDVLMLKKHPHVVDTIRRLRKYVGNVKEWNMTSEDLEAFIINAENIRAEAEKIYHRIKDISKIKEEKGTFWDAFMDLVSDFRKKCKTLTETDILILCAEPGSRQAFFHMLDEVADSEGAARNASNTSEPVLKETAVQGWTEKKE